MQAILLKRRERVRMLIDLATEAQNHVKMWQGYSLITRINLQLTSAHL